MFRVGFCVGCFGYCCFGVWGLGVFGVCLLSMGWLLFCCLVLRWLFDLVCGFNCLVVGLSKFGVNFVVFRFWVFGCLFRLGVIFVWGCCFVV